MAELKSCLQQAEDSEHDEVPEWYDVEFVRVTEALDEAVEYLNARASEESFVLSSKASFKSRRDPLAVKVRSAAALTYVERQKRLSNRNCEKLNQVKPSQAELQRKLFKAKEEAERVRLEAELELEKQRPTSEEAQEMRHWKPKQFDLAEVQAVQNDEGGHDSLEGRLKDFEV